MSDRQNPQGCRIKHTINWLTFKSLKDPRPSKADEELITKMNNLAAVAEPQVAYSKIHELIGVPVMCVSLQFIRISAVS